MKGYHKGHAHGHPTETGHGGESGGMSEHGLSAGKKVKCPIVDGSQSLIEEHSLQHVNYAELTADNMNEFSGE